MGAFLVTVIGWLLSSAIARVLVGGGLSLLVAGGINVAVNGLLSSASSSFGGAGGGILDYVLLGGVGEALSIVGGAIVTRAALLTAGRVLGLVSAGGGA